MNDNGLIGLVCCFGPLVSHAFVFWAAKGFPGWPWKLARRTTPQYYHDEEDY